MPTDAPAVPPRYDPAALRARYRAERDKRLRPDGNEQYVEMARAFAHYLDDPYWAPVERAPLHDDVEVLVGGRLGGLLVGSTSKPSTSPASCAPRTSVARRTSKGANGRRTTGSRPSSRSRR